MHQWLVFFELLKGYDDDITHEFSMALHPQWEDSATTVVRGLDISLSLETICIVTTLPLGVLWSKDEKAVCVTARRNFFI